MIFFKSWFASRSHNWLFFSILSNKISRLYWDRSYENKYSLRDEVERKREITQLFRTCWSRIVQIRTFCNNVHFQLYRHVNQSNVSTLVLWVSQQRRHELIFFTSYIATITSSTNLLLSLNFINSMSLLQWR